jgi:hypothetical protein
MEEIHTNPLFIAFFFVLRCLVPLLIMLGISYLLKRLGLIAEPPKPPQQLESNNHSPHNDNGEGGLAHA